MLAHERIEVEDTAVACLRFENGALGVIQATTSVHPGLAEDDRRSTATRAPSSSSRKTCCAGSSTPRDAGRRGDQGRGSRRRSARPAGRATRRRSRTRATPGSSPTSCDAIRNEHRPEGRRPRRPQGGRADLRDLRVDADREGRRALAMAKKPRKPVADYAVYLAVRMVVCVVQAAAVARRVRRSAMCLALARVLGGQAAPRSGPRQPAARVSRALCRPRRVRPSGSRLLSALRAR